MRRDPQHTVARYPHLSLPATLQGQGSSKSSRPTRKDTSQGRILRFRHTLRRSLKQPPPQCLFLPSRAPLTSRRRISSKKVKRNRYTVAIMRSLPSCNTKGWAGLRNVFKRALVRPCINKWQTWARSYTSLKESIRNSLSPSCGTRIQNRHLAGRERHSPCASKKAGVQARRRWRASSGKRCLEKVATDELHAVSSCVYLSIVHRVLFHILGMPCHFSAKLAEIRAPRLRREHQRFCSSLPLGCR